MVLLFPLCLVAQHTRNVLVLHEGNANHPGNLIESRIFREAFSSDPRNQLFEEYIDEDRLDVTSERLAESLRQKYLGKKMDLVVGGGRPSFNFLLQRGPALWPDVPQVFYFIDARELPVHLPPNVTGVASTVDYGAILDLALRLQPNTREVFYVGGANDWENVWRGFAKQDLQRFSDRVIIHYLNDLALPDLLDRLGRLPQNSVVIYSEMLRDAAGHVFVPGRVCSLIASASAAPVYGPFDTYIGCGIVGGAIADTSTMATQTANLALRVLDRGSAADIPVEHLTNHFEVDFRQLQRWGIAESALPAGTIVRFRTPSVWERFRWYLVAGAVAILGQLALIIILFIEMRRRKKSDVAIKQLNGRLIHASEEERRRIARELHDDIGQRLSLISMDLDVLQQDLNSEQPASMTPPLQEPLEQLNEVISDVHNLSHELHSSKVHVLGLECALKEVCARVARQHSLEINLIADNVPFPLPEEIAFCFYRVAQEALNNSLKHSGSPRIDLNLSAAGGTLQMSVKDYGSGFDVSVAGHGLGLATMRERLRLVDGMLWVHARPGKGVEVTAQARMGNSQRQSTAA